MPDTKVVSVVVSLLMRRSKPSAETVWEGNGTNLARQA